MTKLTVLMTVYNGEAYLYECVESILDQIYTDFQFLILDNASSDNSKEIIRSFHDPRIRLVELPQDIGQVAALNKGFEMIDTPLIARMDADDISLPQRFSRQLEFMENQPEVGVCGTFVVMFSQKEKILKKYPRFAHDIKAKLLFGCCLAHPSVIMRKKLLDNFKLRYDENLGHSEDWDLWQRAAMCFPLANIPEYLLKYRIHEGSMSTQTEKLKRGTAEILYQRAFAMLGLTDSPKRHVHAEIAGATFNPQKKGNDFILQVVQWLEALQSANTISNVYGTKSLEKAVSDCLLQVLENNTRLGNKVLKLFFKRQLFRYAGFIRSSKFMLKALMRYERQRIS